MVRFVHCATVSGVQVLAFAQEGEGDVGAQPHKQERTGPPASNASWTLAVPGSAGILPTDISTRGGRSGNFAIDFSLGLNANSKLGSQ